MATATPKRTRANEFRPVLDRFSESVPPEYRVFVVEDGRVVTTLSSRESLEDATAAAERFNYINEAGTFRAFVEPDRGPDVFEVIFTMRDGSERRWDRLLRPGEVADCLATFNRFTPVNGTEARAVPMRVVPYGTEQEVKAACIGAAMEEESGDLYGVAVFKDGKRQKPLGVAIPLERAQRQADLFNDMMAGTNCCAKVHRVSIQWGEQHADTAPPKPTPKRKRLARA